MGILFVSLIAVAALAPGLRAPRGDLPAAVSTHRRREAARWAALGLAGTVAAAGVLGALPSAPDAPEARSHTTGMPWALVISAAAWLLTAVLLAVAWVGLRPEATVDDETASTLSGQGADVVEGGHRHILRVRRRGGPDQPRRRRLEPVVRARLLPGGPGTGSPRPCPRRRRRHRPTRPRSPTGSPPPS